MEKFNKYISELLNEAGTYTQDTPPADNNLLQKVMNIPQGAVKRALGGIPQLDIYKFNTTNVYTLDLTNPTESLRKLNSILNSVIKENKFINYTNSLLITEASSAYDMIMTRAQWLNKAITSTRGGSNLRNAGQVVQRLIQDKSKTFEEFMEELTKEITNLESSGNPDEYEQSLILSGWLNRLKDIYTTKGSHQIEFSEDGQSIEENQQTREAIYNTFSAALSNRSSVDLNSLAGPDFNRQRNLHNWLISKGLLTTDGPIYYMSPQQFESFTTKRGTVLNNIFNAIAEFGSKTGPTVKYN